MIYALYFNILLASYSNKGYGAIHMVIVYSEKRRVFIHGVETYAWDLSGCLQYRINLPGLFVSQ